MDARSHQPSLRYVLPQLWLRTPHSCGEAGCLLKRSVSVVPPQNDSGSPALRPCRVARTSSLRATSGSIIFRPVGHSFAPRAEKPRRAPPACGTRGALATPHRQELETPPAIESPFPFDLSLCAPVSLPQTPSSAVSRRGATTSFFNTLRPLRPPQSMPHFRRLTPFLPLSLPFWRNSPPSSIGYEQENVYRGCFRPRAVKVKAEKASSRVQTQGNVAHPYCFRHDSPNKESERTCISR